MAQVTALSPLLSLRSQQPCYPQELKQCITIAKNEELREIPVKDVTLGRYNLQELSLWVQRCWALREQRRGQWRGSGVSGSQEEPEELGLQVGWLAKTSVLQSPSRETPGQVELDLDDGAQGYRQVYGFPEVPCLAAQRSARQREGLPRLWEASCLYRGSGTTMASLTCSVGDEQGLLRCIRSSSLSCLMVDHVLLSKALILAKYLSCLGIW